MRILPAALLALPLTACATQGPGGVASAPGQPSAAPAPERPSAEDLASCNGGAFADAAGKFLVAGTAGPGEINVDDLPDPHRVMKPGMAYTMEYNPRRLVLQVDGTGRIRAVRCG